MHPVRQRILELLKQRQQATVAELADALNMAPVSIRYHLDVLQADALIRAEPERREGRVGRPKQVYTLTAQAGALFPDNFGALARGLLRQLKRRLGEEQLAGVFQELAREMAAELAAQCRQPMEELSLEQRLDCVAELLNARGYMAQWHGRPGDGNAAANGSERPEYILYTYNCPYGEAAQEHRELCCMDLALVSNLLGQECERVDSLADDGLCCAYRVQADAPGEVACLQAKRPEGAMSPTPPRIGGRAP